MVQHAMEGKRKNRKRERKRERDGVVREGERERRRIVSNWD